jgi:hypothetical protein
MVIEQPHPDPEEITMKKLIASAAVAASVAVGGLAVASVSPVSVAGAEAAMTAEALPHDGQRVHRILRGIVTTSAEAIGVTPRELVSAYRDGQSIADQATANDVDVQVVKDALVARGTAVIDAALERGAIDADQAARLLDRLPGAVDRVVDHHRGERAETT